MNSSPAATAEDMYLYVYCAVVGLPAEAWATVPKLLKKHTNNEQMVTRIRESFTMELRETKFV